MRLSYPRWVRFGGESIGLIWQTDDLSEQQQQSEPQEQPDGVLVAEGQIVCVRSAGEYKQTATAYGIEIEDDESEELDLDQLTGLLKEPLDSQTCSKLLDGWNLLGDIAHSVEQPLEDRNKVAERCYDKLFYGCNLESITPPGEHYSAVLSKAEKKEMRRIIDRGFRILTDFL